MQKNTTAFFVAIFAGINQVLTLFLGVGDDMFEWICFLAKPILLYIWATKKTRPYFPLYWLVYRDRFNGLS